MELCSVLNHKTIKLLRIRRKLTMEQAAKAVGMRQRQAWYRIESGLRKGVSLKTLVKIARVLKCSLDVLVKK